MTAVAPTPGTVSVEAALVRRVLSALLREDVAGLRTAGTLVAGPDGDWLHLADAAGTLRLPVEPDGYQCTHRARLALLVVDGVELTTTDAVLAALARRADPQDRPGYAAFAEECRQTAATMRLHAATEREVEGLLAKPIGHVDARVTGEGRGDSTRAEDKGTSRRGSGKGTSARGSSERTGLRGSLAYDVLAARHDHPVYPTARGRAGLAEEQLRAYAPEFAPRFPLHRLLLPREAVTLTGWDTEGDRVSLPVHPLTVGAPLRRALRAAGLAGHAELTTDPHGPVTPTLSMRTVAVLADPSLHLKLPLATATLGARNRRTIKPGTLVDGAAGQRLIETVLAREPRFQGLVLHADESTYAHAGHELLAVLERRHPKGLEHATVVPMAALLAPDTDGRRVIDALADRYHQGDPLQLLDAMLTLLFDWQTTLFAYGIALESHQQNISLVLDDRPGTPRLRLLLKDNDGPRIHTARMRAALGQQAPRPSEFDDARIFTDGDGPLVDLFTTITVHLCAGAYAFGLSRRGHACEERLLRLVRDRLARSVERLDSATAEVLRRQVLDAPTLPIKAMVTAGTLLTKERSGAADINKHYTTGPNYLRTQGG